MADDANREENSGEDEDYNPAEDMSVDQEDDDDIVQISTATKSQHLSTVQQNAVDSSFEKLFGYKWGSSFQFSYNSLSRRDGIILEILGPSAAAVVLRSSPSEKKSTKKLPRKVYRAVKPYSGKKEFSQEEAGAVAARKQLIVETNRPQKSSGVGNLLRTLTSTGKVSTVQKTSTDWDQFKEKTGLASKLEEQAESNNALLKRRDFLSRVDQRQFEIERQQRERNRVKRK